MRHAHLRFNVTRKDVQRIVEKDNTLADLNRAIEELRYMDEVPSGIPIICMTGDEYFNSVFA